MTADRDDTASNREERTGDARTIPAEDDHGKTVVDRRSQEIGKVTDVEGDTMYVDPDPSITERSRPPSTGTWTPVAISP